LAAEQTAALDAFWRTSDVQIDGDVGLQQGLRYNLFSLFQSAGRDGRTSIAAKGLTGQGYEGHYFWDTEIYVLPFFAYTQHEIARALVRYRCSIIDAARARAREMSQRGALFPWRTIGGEETSAYYPAGTAQYHIDADIVHALRVYREASGDATILVDGGAELVFETARMWRSLGAFSARRGGAFCIDEVTGPNEYTALVNNNLYTNMMARENLEYAVAIAAEMAADAPGELRRLHEAIGLTDGEIEGWREAAARMYIPIDRVLGVHAQDDSFLDKEPWNFAGTPAENYPLLLHYHPLVIYRHQVLKQPDVVLAQVLLGHRFTMAEKRRNFLYYDPLTTGDSSLSPCIQSVAAAEIGEVELAREYFTRTARMDLDDMNGNVGDGVHTAAMAGTWISLVLGFAGMRDHDGTLSFDPRLPAGWRGFRFRLSVRGRLLEVDLGRETAVYRLLSGPPIDIVHHGTALHVTTASPVTVSRAPHLSAVIFDLDGVLTDTAELHYQAWKRLCDEMRIPFDRTVNEELRGIGRRESFDIILCHAGLTLTEAEKAACAERKNAMYRELITHLTPADLLPGIPALLAALRAAGIRIGMASASHNAAEIVRRLDIAGFIDAAADPGSVVKGKPDPEIFLTVADLLGVPYDCCVGVEDAVAGIEAIRAAGMFSVGIGARITDADWCLPDTGALAYDELVKRFGERWKP
ncbi:MAG TPA: beta-phosphoglucomutase, partial [Spirochaetia bacterium]